jgi:arsenate reductase
MKLYHNPRCSKSREGLAILKDRNVDFEIVEYLKVPLTKKELSNIIKKLNIAPIDLVRKNESIWKEKFKGQNLDNEQVLNAMVEYPKLIEHPILVNENLAVVGRPPEQLISII